MWPGWFSSSILANTPFKAGVVKLKKLGLTQSFEVGYELSPKGRAFLGK